jgi:Flp pilus assembly protein TadG
MNGSLGGIIPKRFLGDRSGSVAVVAAVSIAMLLLAAGLALDAIRAYDIRTELQAAADGAALAAASQSSRTSNKVEANGKAFFKANSVPASTATVTEPVVVHDTAAQRVTVSATATMDTSFMRLAGFHTLTIPVSATAGYGGTPKSRLELVVVPDVSASMAAKWPGETVSLAYGIGTNGGSLVTGLEKLVTKAKFRAGVVPFNSYVKFHQSNMPAGIASGNSTGKAPSCDCYNSCDGVTGPCVSTCEGGRFMCDGNDATYFGCVGPYDVNQNKTPYPRAYGDCGINALKMQNLASEAFYASSALKDTSTGGLGPSFIPSGLLWAWNMLTPEMPLTSALPPKDAMKIVLLISDGINTASPRYPSFPLVNDETGDFVDAKVNPDTSWLDGTKADKLTGDLCRKMKDYGIIIYTLHVGQATTTSTKLMSDCASDTTNVYSVTRLSQVKSTFTAIMDSMAKRFLTTGSGGAPFLIN